MTVPMLPGIGDTLRNNLPQLGEMLMKIAMPQKYQELKFKEAIQQNPQLLEHFATISKTNPNALGNIFGQNVAQYAGGLNESPQAALGRTVANAGMATANQHPELVGQAALGIDPTGEEIKKQQASIGKIDVQQAQTVWSAYQALPEDVRKKIDFAKVAGMTREQWQETEYLGQKMDAAMPLRGKSAKEVVQMYNAGQIDSQAVEGWAYLHPKQWEQQMQDVDWWRRASLQRELANEARRNNRNDLMQQLFIQGARDATSLGVKPGAYFEAMYGFKAPESVGGLTTQYTAEEVKEAKNALTQRELLDRAKAFKPLNDAYKNYAEKRNDATRALLNAAAQAVGVDLRVVRQDRIGPFNKDVFLWNKQEIKPEELSTILAGGNFQPGTSQLPFNPSVDGEGNDTRDMSAQGGNVSNSEVSAYGNRPGDTEGEVGRSHRERRERERVERETVRISERLKSPAGKLALEALQSGVDIKLVLANPEWHNVSPEDQRVIVEEFNKKNK